MGQKYTETKKKYWRKKTTKSTPLMSTNEKMTLWQKLKNLFTRNK